MDKEVEELFNIMRNEEWFRKSKIPTHEDIHVTCEKIVRYQKSKETT